ncbi:hypothetical protein HBB16_17470 [Pseudonocardia sp. MCCB 268]|nr:hypothetical protein [Pseudonocardia cytotoxica]
MHRFDPAGETWTAGSRVDNPGSAITSPRSPRRGSAGRSSAWMPSPSRPRDGRSRRSARAGRRDRAAGLAAQGGEGSPRTGRLRGNDDADRVLGRRRSGAGEFAACRAAWRSAGTSGDRPRGTWEMSTRQLRMRVHAAGGGGA